MISRSILRRSVVWLWFGTKVRPAVVLSVGAESTIVFVAGTSKDKLKHGVCVSFGSQEQQQMGLTETTYFYPANIGRLPLTEIRSHSGHCPFGVWLALQPLCAEELANACAGKLGD